MSLWRLPEWWCIWMVNAGVGQRSVFGRRPQKTSSAGWTPFHLLEDTSFVKFIFLLSNVRSWLSPRSRRTKESPWFLLFSSDFGSSKSKSSLLFKMANPCVFHLKFHWSPWTKCESMKYARDCWTRFIFLGSFRDTYLVLPNIRRLSAADRSDPSSFRYAPFSTPFKNNHHCVYSCKGSRDACVEVRSLKKKSPRKYHHYNTKISQSYPGVIRLAKVTNPINSVPSVGKDVFLKKWTWTRVPGFWCPAWSHHVWSQSGSSGREESWPWAPQRSSSQHRAPSSGTTLDVAPHRAVPETSVPSAKTSVVRRRNQITSFCL